MVSPKARFADQRKTLQLSPKQADMDLHAVVKMLNFNRKISVAPMMDWTDRVKSKSLRQPSNMAEQPGGISKTVRQPDVIDQQ
jgi:hypothetical protein